MIATLAVAGIAALSALGDGARTYSIVYETEDAASASVVRETLTIQSQSGRTYVVVANANGAAAGFPTVLAPDGESAAATSDPAIVCYDMAMSLVAQHERAPAGPLAVLFSFGGRPTEIPLRVKRTQLANAPLVAEGQVGGATVDTRIDLNDGDLSDAVLQELTFGGTPTRVVSRTICSLGTTVRSATPAPAIERT